MKERSARKMLETWRWMENRQVCVWIDNCYIKQYGTHPTIQDQSQNCTAFASLRFRAGCRISEDTQTEMCSSAASAAWRQRL